LSSQSEGRPDIVVDCSQPGQLETLKKNPFTVKEGSTFRMKVKYKVQHDIISGLKYIQVVKRMGLTQKSQEMIVRTRLVSLWAEYIS
jgi:Rho GDP-dissociation inhibitor